MKEKCDGCGEKLNPDNYNIVKFRTMDNQEEVHGAELNICPKCMNNLEAIVQEAMEEERNESL